MKRKLPNNRIHLLSLFLLVPILLLILAAISQPQRIKQYAQDTFNEPPLYGCLQVGEGNKSTCASKLGVTTAYSLTLHGRPLEKQTTVYYGDRLKGSVNFTNVGDLPIALKSVGLRVETSDKKISHDLVPLQEKRNLQPRETVTVNSASYKFVMPDPSKDWIAGSKIIVASGEEIPTADVKQKIAVNASCTALRILELTDKDKKNLQTLCSKNPGNKLCSSKQYCEIFQGQGANCAKPNASPEIPEAQCDEWIVPERPEQDLLEELCKVYPDTDACVRFCMRSVESPICPVQYVWVDKKTKKELLPQPKIIKEPQTHLLRAAKQQRTVAGVTTKDPALVLAQSEVTSTGVEPNPPEAAELIVATDTGIFDVINPINAIKAVGRGIQSGANKVLGALAPGLAPKDPGCGNNFKTQLVTGQCNGPAPARKKASGPSRPLKTPFLEGGPKTPRSLSQKLKDIIPGIKDGPGVGRAKEIAGQDCIEGAVEQFFKGKCTPVAEPNLPEGCATLRSCYATREPRGKSILTPSAKGKRPCSYDGTVSFGKSSNGTCTSARFAPGNIPSIKVTRRNADGTLDPKREVQYSPIDLLPVGRIAGGVEKALAYFGKEAVHYSLPANEPEIKLTTKSCNKAIKNYCDRLSPGKLQNDCRKNPAIAGC